MGVFDKIKNALFEVEYVEVEDKPKKDKKSKPVEKKETNLTEEKPIAKKIVLPGKREEKVEKIQEEELVDKNFESRPKDDLEKVPETNSFKFMDDADFQVDDEPKIIENLDEVEVLNPVVDTPVLQTNVSVEQPRYSNSYRGVSPVQNVDVPSSVIDNYKVKERESRPYGMDPSYHVSIKEYGSYETKDDKTYFKPSPIISPIYGILDKNYKKEDVVQKKDIRITSSYSRTNVNVDDIRNKAYGRRSAPEPEKKENVSDVVVEDEEENLFVDLSDDNEKPEVKEITMGDAMEYFQDLGLEYNVDYVDASSKGASKKTDDAEVIEEVKEKSVPIPAPVKEDATEKDTPIVEVKNESGTTLDDEDNLFDLIDSMYKDNN